MPKQPLFSKNNAELPLVRAGAVENARRLRAHVLFVRLAVGLLALLTAYELAQFGLGACQGYSGVAAYERSILGQHFEFWSIDPETCR
jgi:hypothetical protein